MPEEAMKKLSDVPYDQTFVTNCGTEIKNLEDLVEKLKNMDEASFNAHVNNEKNDFAAWIRYSVKDEKLASALDNVKDIPAMRIAILNRIDELKQIIQKDQVKKQIEDVAQKAPPAVQDNKSAPVMPIPPSNIEFPKQESHISGPVSEQTSVQQTMAADGGSSQGNAEESLGMQSSSDAVRQADKPLTDPFSGGPQGSGAPASQPGEPLTDPFSGGPQGSGASASQPGESLTDPFSGGPQGSGAPASQPGEPLTDPFSGGPQGSGAPASQPGESLTDPFSGSSPVQGAGNRSKDGPGQNSSVQKPNDVPDAQDTEKIANPFETSGNVSQGSPTIPSKESRDTDTQSQVPNPFEPHDLNPMGVAADTGKSDAKTEATSLSNPAPAKEPPVVHPMDTEQKPGTLDSLTQQLQASAPSQQTSSGSQSGVPAGMDTPPSAPGASGTAKTSAPMPSTNPPKEKKGFFRKIFSFGKK